LAVGSGVAVDTAAASAPSWPKDIAEIDAYCAGAEMGIIMLVFSGQHFSPVRLNYIIDGK
jgi:hypothetical protein